MRRLLLGCFFAVVFAGGALAALHFPALTGRVVDAAGILSEPARQNLEQTLADFEKRSTDQVVVVTLHSLEGVSIEDYGYQLGRFWGIGQKEKNNGVLLIVAPTERKVRIEVGYGLEGTLTDAAASEIVQGIILPDFRAGHMEQGIVNGAKAIVEALGGKTYEPVVPIHSIHIPPQDIFWLAVFVVFLIGKFVLLLDPKFYREHPILAMFLLMSGSSRSSGGGGFSGGFGGGGFSGGGGGFGGGGASGGW